MKKKIQPCDVQCIESFLNDQLKDEQREEFLVHIESCDSCRTALAGEAAGPEFWTEAAGLLGDNTFGGEIHDDVTRDREAAVAKFSITTILDWLSPTDDPEMLGRIGEYEISGVVGIGGMGAVLKGFDKSLLRVVAIKVMAPHLANNGSARHRFEREARAAAAISHDNVIDIYCVAEMNGLPYLVMPFARGPSLQKRIDEGGPLSTMEVVQVGRQIASGLAAAHEQGLVHRDIKPANILLNDGIERLLITDFGVARAMDDASMTQTGLIAGTPQFMSPEQARGETVDHRSDLFSLGSVLYTSCTGRPPFRADVPFAVLRKITDTEPRPIREINPEIPDWLENSIHCLLHKDRTTRFDDAKQVAQLFEKCLAHLRQPIKTALPRSITRLPVKHFDAKAKSQSYISKKKLGIIMSAIAIVVLGGLALFQLTDAPDISGTWNGESWNHIHLSSVREANHWYAGNFTDANGNVGAIHLEWSRLSRRFDGRWSIGPNTSGTIVLRSGTQGSVRGAILMDSEAPQSPNTVRLRDFVWTPSDSIVQIDIPQYDPARTNMVISPAGGIVKKVGPGVRNGAIINKGDLIVEIQAQQNNSWKSERRMIESKIQTAEQKVDAYSMNAEGFTEARDFAIESATELANAAKSQYQSKIDSISGLHALEKQARLNHERQSKLHEAGLAPETQMQSTKVKWEVALSNLKAAESDAETLKSEWNAKLLDIEEKGRLAQTKIDFAMGMQQDSAEELAKLRNELKDLDARAAETARISIHAPVTGTISAWRDLTPGKTIIEGSELLKLLPSDGDVGGDESDNEKRNPPAPQLNQSSDSFDLESVPAMLNLAANLQTRLRDANSKIDTRQREIDRHKAEIASYEKAVNKAKTDLDSTPESDQALRAQLSSRLDQQQAEFAFRQRQLENAESSLANEQANLNLAESELATMTKLLQLELESQAKQMEQASKTAELKRIQYEQGDLTLIEVQKQDMNLQQLQTKVQQLERVLDHFRRIQ